jgi:class 3 adenylate cyclase/CheY-like chemotaxis protein
MIPSDDTLIIDGEAVSRAERYRRQKSTAVLTIMFTDIVGSTELRESLGEIAYERAREEHDQAIHALIEAENAGAVVKGTGDGILAVFAEPSTAVERSLRIQGLMQRHPRFRLRIGLDMGQVSKETMGGIVIDVFGKHVNRAARVTRLADPEQILATYQVYDCSVGWLDARQVGWRVRGPCELKGFPDAVFLHEPFDKQQAIRKSSSIEEDSAYDYPGMRRIIGEALSVADEERAAAELRTLEGLLFWLRFTLLNKGKPVKLLGKPDRSLEKTSVPARNKSILWVDDYPENNARLSALLRKAGCVVATARSTEEALVQLKNNFYRVIITDMGRDGDPEAGLDFLKRIRKRRWEIPVIVFTSATSAALVGAQAKKLGAMACTPGAATLVANLLKIFIQDEEEPLRSGLERLE